MNPAQRKIVALLVDLITYELGHLSDGMLLTDEARRATTRHPVLGRTLILTAGTLLTGHLAGIIPERYDLLGRRFWQRRGRASDAAC